LNSSAHDDFEELLFWGKIVGQDKDYFIAMGVTYTDKYEFPEKCFFWASSADFVFKPFKSMNDQHKEKYNALVGFFTGDPAKVLVKVEPEVDPEAEEAPEEPVAEEEVTVDPLASSEEEDPNKNFVARDLTELDRLHYTVLAIENDCHILPQGAVKLTDAHEIRRNNAFQGLSHEQAFDLTNYSHFRNVQNNLKQTGLL